MSARCAESFYTNAIHRALLGAGVPSTFLYGVDDMDAMDSQAKLTPDAIDK